MENRALGNPDTVLIHVGTNDLRRTRNLGCVTGEVYALVATTKFKFLHCRIVLSDVVWSRDMM